MQRSISVKTFRRVFLIQTFGNIISFWFGDSEFCRNIRSLSTGTLSDKTSSDKIFVGQNFSSDKIFVTFPNFRHFCPTKRFQTINLLCYETGLCSAKMVRGARKRHLNLRHFVGHNFRRT